MLAIFRPVILGLKKFLLFRIKSLYRSFTQYWHNINKLNKSRTAQQSWNSIEKMMFANSPFAY